MSERIPVSYTHLDVYKRQMQERIAGAELVEFHAAHLSNVQAGDDFSQRVLDFLRA